jgi:hypothetical protein
MTFAISSIADGHPAHSSNTVGVADPEAAVPVADRFCHLLVFADQQERRVEDSADSTGN